MTTRLLVGDVFDRMHELPDGSFDLVVTSPPFYGVRSYLPDDHPDKWREIGSEPTIAGYLDKLLMLTAEWRRLLAPHGSLAVELGDTYAGSGGAGGDYDEDGLREGQPKFRVDWSKSGLLDKSLCGIPTLYAWSLAYGRNLLTGQPSPAGRWRVRNLKPWIRSNPPVGALGDKERPATSYITVACVGSSRWFDLDAVRTPYAFPNHPQVGSASVGNYKGDGSAPQGRVRTEHPGGAPPLDWWHPIDALIDQVIRERSGKTANRRTAKGVDSTDRSSKSADRGGNWGSLPELGETNGSVGPTGKHIRRALETAGYLIPDGFYDISPKGYSGMTRPTTRLVPCGPHDGGLRTTSRGCPTHGDRPGPAPTAPDDAHAETSEIRTRHNGDRHAQEQLAGSAPTAPQTGQPTVPPSSDSLPRPCAPAAIPHSTASNRTGPAPSTSPADTPSVETTGRTAHMSTSPSSGEPHPDTSSSRTGAAYRHAAEPGTAGDTAGTSDPLAACTCSYHLAVNDDESTSHYAVWPPELARLLILEMCPRRVCTSCGQPSRRISGDTWSDCGHGTWRRGRVLDPFAGSCTTLDVANTNGYDSVGIDLDERSAELGVGRVGMFLDVDYPEREVPA